MKQATITFLLFFPLYFSSFTQGFYQELEVGPNFPIGTFKSATGSPNGRVHMGFQASMAISYKFPKNWSLGIRTLFTINNLDYPPLLDAPHNPWLSSSILLSAKIYRSVTEELQVVGEVLTGPVWLTFPNAVYSGNFGRTGVGFVSGLRLGFIYFLTDKFAIKLNIQYLEGNATLKNDQVELSRSLNLSLLSWGILFEL